MPFAVRIWPFDCFFIFLCSEKLSPCNSTDSIVCGLLTLKYLDAIICSAVVLHATYLVDSIAIYSFLVPSLGQWFCVWPIRNDIRNMRRMERLIGIPIWGSCNRHEPYTLRKRNPLQFWFYKNHRPNTMPTQPFSMLDTMDQSVNDPNVECVAAVVAMSMLTKAVPDRCVHSHSFWLRRRSLRTHLVSLKVLIHFSLETSKRLLY